MKRTWVIALLAAVTLAVFSESAHARRRVFNQQLARFMQRDPEEYVDGSSLYEYERSGPVMWLDPSGTKVEIIMIRAFGVPTLYHPMIVVTDKKGEVRGFHINPNPNLPGGGGLGDAPAVGACVGRIMETPVGYVRGLLEARRVGEKAGREAGESYAKAEGLKYMLRHRTIRVPKGVQDEIRRKAEKVGREVGERAAKEHTRMRTRGAAEAGAQRGRKRGKWVLEQTRKCNEGRGLVGVVAEEGQRNIPTGRKARDRRTVHPGHEYDERVIAAAKGLKWGDYRLSSHNSMHWGKAVIEQAGLTWPYPTLNYGINPGNREYPPPEKR